MTPSLLRHERPLIGVSIGLLVALSWFFLVRGAGMDSMQPPLAALVLMWWLMMVAMMLPSAAPAVLLYSRVRDRQPVADSVVEPWIFMLGYLGVWLLFSLFAAAVHHQIAPDAMKFQRGLLPALVLVAAGAYQLSPLKGACLRQCRAPAQFLSRHWRAGARGAVRLGVLHGAYCVGCCWLLMALLFVGGVMNFAWIAALTLLVSVEKLVPRGDLVARAAGVALIGWGLLYLVA